ncbi:11872_t:CDS:2 [Entrophospora sp. SA101]|nr:7498_t:CDS:2 [Entrophospora sp. SA101]CAJ0752788.1 11872_t:CDS:2 [Entrophospora sp. SA101]
MRSEVEQSKEEQFKWTRENQQNISHLSHSWSKPLITTVATTVSATALTTKIYSI